MRAVRKRPNYSRLCVCIILPYLNGFTLAAQIDGQDGLCEHHPAHSADCGFVEAVEGRPCAHVHSEEYGCTEGTPGAPCTHRHTEDCYVAECVHVHDDSCYAGAEPPADSGEPQPPVDSEEIPPPVDSEEIPPPVDSEETPSPVDSEETPSPAEQEQSAETPPSGEIEDMEPPLAELSDDRPPLNCAHRCTEESGCVTLVCEHVHSEECGYIAPAEAACAHIHDEACGFAEAVEGRPCEYICQLCGTKEVLSWSWVDEDEALVCNEETAVWGLAVPGVSRERPLTAADLQDLLPGRAEVELDGGGRETAAVTWDLSGILEEGVYEGTFFVYAALPGEYRLGEGTAALAVLLDLGGAEMYDDVPKYVSNWSYVPQSGSPITEPEPFRYCTDLHFPIPADRSDLIKRLRGMLPDRILCMGYNTNNQLVLAGFTPAEGQTGPGYLQGYVEVTWNIEAVLNSAAFGNMSTFTFEGAPVSNPGYNIRVNSNNTDLPEAANDTSEIQGVLNLTVTLYDVDLSSHTKTAANPANTTVNLFDYCVDPDRDGADGKDDRLTKSDWHQGQTTSYARTAEEDWKKGINEGHLLIFGDGLIHAGYWNKGAGAITDFGKVNAGMMGIVESTLKDDYPVINTTWMNESIDGFSDITDYLLCGDHDPSGGEAYTSINPRNISETVQKQWNGSASLDYLFDPAIGHDGKTSYTNVEGLFQLDPMGYYYYDMRQNFAEYDGDTNRFILYDAPAAQRTDNSYENGGFGDKRSVGNFLPFNTAEQVFDGVRDGRLYSSENITTHNGYVKNGNYLNHNLGMTVSIDFRQPAGGMVNAGVKGNVPMTFQFSGDDDVWVFIDDVLVLDLGGTHSEIYGTIDFSSGAVSVGQSWKTNGFPYKSDGTVDVDALTQNAIQNTTLKALFEEAEKLDTISWNGNTFASDTDHTLRMFYLERGNYDSSLAFRFNLQPQLNQQIRKVDQAGQPMEDVEFRLYPAGETGNGRGAIECFYTDSKTSSRMRVQNNRKFYVTQSGDQALCTLRTDPDGTAKFLDSDGNPFNFADLGERYYILKETRTPPGYRPLPVPVVLHYDTETSMLSVANRWTTGAYSCSVSNILGSGVLTYGYFENGNIQQDKTKLVSSDKQENGLVVAVPMLLQQSESKWIALYGSNLHGFGSVRPAERTAEEWRKAVLEAALRQAAAGEGYAEWRLDWDADNRRLTGTLDDLPGLASRYQINGGDDMRMVYGIIEPAALSALGIHEADAAARYRALGEYVRENGPEKTLAAIMNVKVSGTGSSLGFSFLNVDQFNRNFRSLIYIPNEQRELRVQKVDEDGRPLAGASFTLFKDQACTDMISSGTTDYNGLLIFSPRSGGGSGYAQVTWADAAANTTYYLRETGAPAGYTVNSTVIPIVVGVYSVYADAGTAGDGVSVMAGVGTLTQTMHQYAMDNDVDITLRDIVTTMQVQPSGGFTLDGWEDQRLENTGTAVVFRTMDLHYGINLVAEYGVDYGLHDVDITGDQGTVSGEKTNIQPFFVTDEGFIRTRVRQNYPALTGSIPKYEGAKTDTNKDDLGDLDLTSLFSLLNVVVVTDKKPDTPRQTGDLRISKKLEGSGLEAGDYTRNFTFTVTFADDAGNPLDGEFHYFWGKDKVGKIKSGGTITLHHDDTVIIQGLPAGTSFAVTETAEAGWHVRPSRGVISGEITAGETAGADFVNSKDPSADLSVSKTVTGDGGDTEKEFTFTITLSKDGRPLPGYYKYTGAKTGELGNSGSVKLKHGQRITIHDLPVGTVYKVEESDSEGYTVTHTGDAGTIEANKTSEAAFTNHKPKDPPKDPEDPKDPPKDPEDPEDPKDPPKDPEEPEIPPEDPEETEIPPEDPETPPDRPTELPDPNDPDSPDTITIWDDGVPKTYIRVWDPEEGEWVYIPDNEVPLIPMTEDTPRTAPWIMVCLSSLAGLCAFLLKKRPEEEG